MQNKWNDCPAGGFVPADTNWDFARCGREQETCSRCNRKREQCACAAYKTQTSTRDVNCTQLRNAEEYRETCFEQSCEAAAQHAQSCGLTLGMVTAQVQILDDMYDAAHALKAGTLFPGLHMPLNGYGPRGGNCATGEQEAAFTLWELRLYLNTHPHDQEALALFARLCRGIAGTTYATAFLPDDGCGQGWNWINDPWPWEYACRCG